MFPVFLIPTILQNSRGYGGGLPEGDDEPDDLQKFILGAGIFLTFGIFVVLLRYIIL